MSSGVDWSLNAKVEQHGEDVALRVQMTAFDESGHDLHTYTWRGREQRLPELGASEDVAWFLLCLLVKVLEREGSVGRINAAVDPALF